MRHILHIHTRNLLTLVAGIGLLMATSGCSIFGGSDNVEKTEKTSPATNTDTASKPVPVNIFAGNNVNRGNSDKPLALVVRMYLLHEPDKFEQMSFDTLVDADKTKDMLGSDLVESREVLFVPGQQYSGKATAPQGNGYLGVVALFRDPAPMRWRVVFDLNKTGNKPITIGLHDCAMTVTSGATLNKQGLDLDRLSNARCPSEKDKSADK